MLARYNAWANQRIFDAVAALPPGEAEKPRKSLFKNMVHMLNHNYVIDRIFQAHLEGRRTATRAHTPGHPRSPNCGATSRRSMPGTSRRTTR